MSRKFSAPNRMTAILGSVTFDRQSSAANEAAEVNPNTRQASGKPLKIPLKLIRLNLNQPRKLLAPELARRIAGGLDLVEAMRQWAQNTQAALHAEYQQDETGTAGAHATGDARLNVIRERAWSIHQHGLLEAINVFANDDGAYEVQNGECRTLAHAWLVACGERRFEHIEAVVRDRSKDDYTKKLVENLEREDLSAIEMGIGAWMARLEMSGQPVPDFNTLETFGQLAEIDRKRAGKQRGLVEWQAVEKALGKTMQWRWNATEAFGFPPEAIAIILRHRLNGRALRPLFKLRETPAMQVRVLQSLEQLAAEKGADIWTQASVAAEIAKAEPAKTTAPKKDAAPDPAAAKSAAVKQSLSALRAAFGPRLSEAQLRDEASQLQGDDELVRLTREVLPVIQGLLDARKVGQ